MGRKKYDEIDSIMERDPAARSRAEVRLLYSGYKAVRAYRRAAGNPLLVCCVLGVVAYAVHAFFGYSLPINSPLMWVLFGLTGAAIRSGEPAEAKQINAKKAI